MAEIWGEGGSASILFDLITFIRLCSMPVGSVRFRLMLLDCVRVRSVHSDSDRFGFDSVRFRSTRFGSAWREEEARGTKDTSPPLFVETSVESVSRFDSTARRDIFFFFVPEVRPLPLCYTNRPVRVALHTHFRHQCIG